MLLDLSAAFDTVDHNKLLNILKYEILLEGEALNWSRSFLCGRCQKVHVEGYESVEILIKFGVPQGSVLGPVLFNMGQQFNVLACQLPQLFNQITLPAFECWQD